MKSQRNNLILFALLALLVMVEGCATMGQQKVSTQKRQIAIWTDVYYAQFDDVKAVLENPASLPEQKAVARQKKEILIQVWPLLTAYVDLVDNGGTPTQQDVAAIDELINQLTRLAINRQQSNYLSPMTLTPEQIQYLNTFPEWRQH